jgi:hypothetical protein
MRLSHKQKGSLLISALLLFSILLTLGLGILSSQSARMKGAQAQVKSLQAKQLALAGWEDLKVKLGKDQFFLQMVEDQTYLSYSEDVYIPDPGGVSDELFYGTYTVVCDTSRVVFLPQPQGIYLVTITGKVGERNQAPEAERKMEFEINVADNRVIRIYDEGSL